MTATYSPRPDLIQVTYRVLSDKLIDPERKAKAIAQGQARSTGVVLGIDEWTHQVGSPYEYYLTVGFAVPQGGISTLLSMVLGTSGLDIGTCLESIQFPEDYLKGKGPRHGVAGLRARAGEATKPLLMTNIAPKAGLSPLNAAPDQFMAQAQALTRQGAECFLVDVSLYGYEAIEEVSRLGVPVMAKAKERADVAYSLLCGTFMRLSGADIVRLPTPDLYAARTDKEINSLWKALSKPLGSLKPVFPAFAGTYDAKMRSTILEDFGMDVILDAG